MTSAITAARPPSRLANHLVGWLLYPSGDLVAQLIMGRPNFLRAAILMLVGGLLYRLEIPAWFRRIDAFRLKTGTLSRHPWLNLFTRDHTTDGAALNWLGRTLGAMVYFNPIWITRHVFFISLATIGTASLSTLLWASFVTGWISFATNLPFSLAANYLVQVHVPPRFRFLASALVTTAFTLKYAIEMRLLQG